MIPYNIIFINIHIRNTLYKVTFLIFLLTTIITIPLNTNAFSQTEKNNSHKFTVQYIYKGLGVGPNPVLGFIHLTEGAEENEITISLLNALQSMEFSIIEPDLSLKKLILQGVKWNTDIVQLSHKILREHNSYS